MSKTASKKSSYHKGNVREDLVDAAEKILRKEGLSTLSLRRVAREVGVAPSAVYNHFRNREALLVAVATDGYRQLSRIENRAYSMGGKPGQVLREMARDYLHFAASNPDLYRLMFSAEVVAYRSDPDLGEAGHSSFGMSVDWWYGKGAYDSSQSALRYPLAQATWAILHGVALQVIDGLVTIDISDKAALDELADSVMEVYINGASAGFPKST